MAQHLHLGLLRQASSIPPYQEEEKEGHLIARTPQDPSSAPTRARMHADALSSVPQKAFSLIFPILGTKILAIYVARHKPQDAFTALQGSSDGR